MLIGYISIGIIWAFIAHYITIQLRYKITWKTYFIGFPFNFIFWPVSMSMCICKFVKNL